MIRTNRLRGASVAALTLSLAASAAAQQSLPTIDIGSARHTRRDARPASRPVAGTALPAAAGALPAEASELKFEDRPGSAQYGAGPGGRFTGYTPDFKTAATTTKDKLSILQTPGSIKVVPRQLLDDKQAITVEDALVGNVAGVQSTSVFYDQFVIRGFPLSSLTLRNNLRVYNFYAHLQTQNLQSIEVLKGPVSLFYGRFEPGGIINLVPKRPLDTPYFSIQEQVGSWSLTRTTVDATGPITADKNWLYRLNLTYNHTDSFRNFVTSQDVQIAPSISWRPSENFRFNLDGEYQNSIWVTDLSPIPAVRDRPARIPINRYMGDPAVQSNPTRQERYFAGFDWTWDITKNWSLTNRFAYASVDFHDRWTTTDSINGNTGVIARHVFDGVLPDRQSLATNLDLNGTFDTGPLQHKVTFGGDYLRTRETTFGYEGNIAAVGAMNIYAPYYSAFPYGLPPQSSYNFFSHQDLSGIYAQDYVSFLDDKVHLLFGGRRDWVSIENGASSQMLEVARLPYNALVTGEGSRSSYDKAWSPRLGAVVQPAPWLSFYFNYSRSFGATNGVPVPGRPLFPPQKGLQYEAGMKAEFLDGRLTATAAYFDIFKSGLVQSVPGSQFVQPVGLVRSVGAELEVAGRIDENWSVNATYSHTNARIVQDLTGQQGNRLQNAPFHDGSVWVKYDASGDLRGLSLGAGVQAVGARQGDNSSTFRLPGYATVNAMAMYRWQPTSLPMVKNLSLQLNVRNLLDEVYYTGANSRTQIMPGAPRTFLFSMRAEF
jgi:iron complex outermembrane recepter protein